MNIIKFDSTPSTNTLLQQLSKEQQLEEGTVLTAREQSSGRGQAGNQWEAEAGKNLTFSIILHPVHVPVSQNFLLSQITSLAIKETLDTFTSGITIKWPNDIYYNDLKIAGILIENEITGNEISQSIIGIGINVNQEVFRSNAPNPVSLKQITGKETDLEEFLLSFYDIFSSKYNSLKTGEATHIVETYHAALYRKTGFHPYTDQSGAFDAEIDHVENSGILVLKDKNQRLRRYSFKEVRTV